MNHYLTRGWGGEEERGKGGHTAIQASRSKISTHTYQISHIIILEDDIEESFFNFSLYRFVEKERELLENEVADVSRGTSINFPVLSRVEKNGSYRRLRSAIYLEISNTRKDVMLKDVMLQCCNFRA